MNDDPSAPTPPPGAEPLPAAASPESPWLGLRSFTEETQPYFFGRSAEVQDLHERIVHKPLTILFGQSGLGKTSLLQAALVPRLRAAGYLPIPLRLEHTASAPGLERQVIRAFYAALQGASAPSVDRSADVENLWLLFHDPQFGFTGADGQGPSGGPRVRPVFLFDQFEEIFTLGERPKCRQDSLLFLDALACLVENRAPESVRRRLETDDDLADRLVYQVRPAKVLLILREDFLHVLERWRRQMPSLMDNRFELRLLTGPQAFQAVVKPGELRGSDRPPIISEETGAAIVRFVAGAAPDVPLAEIDAVPPLLSLICSELNARRFDSAGQAQEEMIHADQLQGRNENILENFYEKSFHGVPATVRRLVEDRLLSADGFRESLALDTAQRLLENGGAAPEAARTAIMQLVDHRLLVVEERGGVRRVELTHDVLTGVARRSRDLRNELEAARREKLEKEAAEARAAQARRAVRRAVMVGVGLALLLAVAVAALAWALVQQRNLAKQKDVALRATRDAEEAKTFAEDQRHTAVAATQSAEAAEQRAQLALSASQAQVRRDSAADAATAGDLAEKGDWCEAVAYLGRALRLDPQNRLAAASLWEELVYGQSKRDYLPQLEVTQDTWAGGMAYSPDGTRFVTTCGDLNYPKTGYAQQWDAATGQPLGPRMQEDRTLGDVAYSPDGKRIVTASTGFSGECWIQQWDAATSRKVGGRLTHPHPVRSVSYRPDGRRILTVCADYEKFGLAQQWDAVTGALLGRVGDGPVYCAAYSPDGKEIAVLAEDGVIHEWTAADNKESDKMAGSHPYACNTLAYSPDGQRIVSACLDDYTRQWDRTTGKTVGVPLPQQSRLKGAIYSPDGTRILTFSRTGCRQWDAAYGRPYGDMLSASDQAVYSPDARFILTSPNPAKEVFQWDAITGRFSDEILTATDRTLNTTAYSPDHRRILVGCGEYYKPGYALQIDAATGEAIGGRLDHDREVTCGRYSPDGSRFVTGCAIQYGNGYAQQWNASTGEKIGPRLTNDEAVASVAFSADGQRIVTGGGVMNKSGGAQQWDAGSGERIGPRLDAGAFVYTVAYSPDGRRVVTGSVDKTLQQWDAATGARIGAPLSMESQVLCVAYSPDGNRIVACSGNSGVPGCVQQWDTATGQPVGKLIKRHQFLQSVGYSPDGLRLLIASNDGTMEEWTADTCQLIGEPLRDVTGGLRASYSADGERIVSSGTDGVVRQWDAVPPAQPLPAWLDQLVEVASGYRFDDDGQLVKIPVSERLALRNRLAEDAPASPAAGRWPSLLRWLMTTPAARTASPGSSLDRAGFAGRHLHGSRHADPLKAVLVAPDQPTVHLAYAQFLANTYFVSSEPAAEFQRKYGLDRLPADPETRRNAAAWLRLDNQGQRALAILKALSADNPRSAPILREYAQCLVALHHDKEALEAYTTLVDLPEAEADDLCQAGKLLARRGQGEATRRLFERAVRQFPKFPRLLRFAGWALLDLNAPAEALEFFKRYEPAVALAGEPPVAEGIAGLALSRWLTNDRQGAVSDCVRLIGLDASFATTAKIENSDWTDASKKKFRELLAETLRLHPEVVPAPANH